MVGTTKTIEKKILPSTIEIKRKTLEKVAKTTSQLPELHFKHVSRW